MFSTVSLKTGRVISKNVRHIATQEVQIPFPWGHIAGKWWGPEDKRPILALHGWQDNGGTFDTLIPHLPKHIPVLALDFPGHGHSSCVPSGMPCYTNFNKVILIKWLARYFGWKKLSLMGHSLGSMTCYTYSFLFPKEVDFLICIDGLYPPVLPNEYDRIAKSIESFIKYNDLYNSQVEAPSYTLAEMEEKIHRGSLVYFSKSVDVESAKYLLARNIEPSKLHPGKFCFKSDPRIKSNQLEMHDPVQLVQYASRIECPIIVTRTRRGAFFGGEGLFRDVCAMIRKSSRASELHEVPGTHHVHLNKPEVVAKLINDFIVKHNVDERSHGGIKQEIRVPGDVYGVTLEKLEAIRLKHAL